MQAVVLCRHIRVCLCSDVNIHTNLLDKFPALKIVEMDILFSCSYLSLLSEFLLIGQFLY